MSTVVESSAPSAVIQFSGHPAIRGLHRTTWQLTREPHLTTRADCIVGVNASIACRDLPDSLKRALRQPAARVQLRLTVGNAAFETWAYGSPALRFDDQVDLVVRRSTYVCGRTVAIRCQAAARDIPRNLIRALTRSDAEGTLALTAYIGGSRKTSYRSAESSW